MNVVVIVRINSPGNDGPITQNNITVASSTAANGAATAQGAVADVAAATTQQATSTATATQDAAGNLARIVRFGSPGKDGAVAQTNTAVGGSNATNTSDTIQQVAAPKPAVEPQPRRAGAAAPRKPSRLRQRQPAATVRAPVESSRPPVATSVAKPAAIHKVAPGHAPQAVAQTSPVHTHRLPTLSSITSGAAQALSPFVPPASPVAGGATGSDDLSSPVLLTLLLAAAAAAATFALRRAPARRRAASWRSPR
jgi:hypothetical protein